MTAEKTLPSLLKLSNSVIRNLTAPRIPTKIRFFHDRDRHLTPFHSFHVSRAAVLVLCCFRRYYIVQFSMLINLSINHHLQLSMGRIGVGLSPKLLMGVAEGMEVGGTVGGGLAQTTAVN